jgi:hypothetical protein
MVLSVNALAIVSMVRGSVLGIEFTYVAGRGGEGAALDSTDNRRGVAGGEHDV